MVDIHDILTHIHLNILCVRLLLQGHADIVNMLLKAGCNKDAADKVRFKYLTIARVFPSCIDSFGESPLGFAKCVVGVCGSGMTITLYDSHHGVCRSHVWRFPTHPRRKNTVWI